METPARGAGPSGRVCHFGSFPSGGEYSHNPSIARALQATKGSVTKAAKLLGIGRATLYRRLASPELAGLRPRRNYDVSPAPAVQAQVG